MGCKNASNFWFLLPLSNNCFSSSVKLSALEHLRGAKLVMDSSNPPQPSISILRQLPILPRLSNLSDRELVLLPLLSLYLSILIDIVLSISFNISDVTSLLWTTLIAILFITDRPPKRLDLRFNIDRPRRPLLLLVSSLARRCASA